MANMMRRMRLRGMALISALMVLVILGIIAGCFAMVMNRDSRQSRISSYQIICLNAAQAGIDYAMMLHKHNMAFYPMVDYSRANSNDNEMRFPDFSNKEQYIFPAMGTIYNLPQSALKDTSGNLYNPVFDRRGIYKNQSSTTKNFDTEYMFVNDLSFWSDPSGNYEEGTSFENFMHDTQYCVTFQIRESVATVGNKSVLHLVSTGKLRAVPDGYDWDDEDGWLTFAQQLGNSTTGTSISSRRLDDLGFTEYASRTVSADFHFDNISSTATTGAYPRAVTEGLSDELPANRQNQMPEQDKREWFR